MCVCVREREREREGGEGSGTFLNVNAFFNLFLFVCLFVNRKPFSDIVPPARMSLRES